MFENHNCIKIKGRKFENETTFKFFDTGKRLSFVFGRNGSGKSTIATGLKNGEIADLEGLNSDLSISLFGDTSAIVELRGDNAIAPAKIRVFDEAYVDRNIRLRAEGLKTIVLVGQDGSVQGMLDETRLEIKEKTSRLNAKMQELESRRDNRQRLPSEVKYDEINKRLRGEKGWAERERIIKDGRIKSAVTDDTVRNIISCSDNRPLLDLNKEYEQSLNDLRIAKGNAEEEELVASVTIQQLPDYSNVEREILAVLPLTAPRPVASDDVARILNILHSRHQPWIEEIKEDFAKSDTTFCPYCMRDITEVEKREIVDKIGKVIRKDAEELIARIKNITFPQIVYVDEKLKRFNSEYYNELIAKVVQIKEKISRYQNIVQTKLNNVFEAVEFPSLELSVDVQKVNEIFSKFKSIQDAILLLIRTRTGIQKALSDLNKAMAKQEIKDLYSQYITYKQEEATLIEEKDIIEREIQGLRQREAVLVSQLNETNLAVDEINMNLSLVYMSKTRMSVRADGDKYVLKINGRNVAADKVSTGERNVLGLAYFFADMMRGMRPSDAYRQEYLIVLDDPTSSFDQDTRVGVLSFLAQKFRKILLGNDASHILVLTHEFFVLYGLCKTFQRQRIRDENGQDQVWDIHAAYTLENDKAMHVNIENLNEYGHLLKTTYKYAIGSQDVDGISIGNTMRRMLESFSTFMFRNGIDELFLGSRAENYLCTLSSYFQTSLSRFVLNDGSHLQSHVQSLEGDGALFAEFSDQDKRRVAKDVLCLLHLYNKDHVEAYLEREFTGACQRIEAWVQEVKDNVAT